MHYVGLKHQYDKNRYSNFLKNWQPNAELQNAGTNQLTVLNVTHFQLEVHIIEKSINNILYTPVYTEGRVELKTGFSILLEWE